MSLEYRVTPAALNAANGFGFASILVAGRFRGIRRKKIELGDI
jgi:hypothetical protein